MSHVTGCSNASASPRRAPGDERPGGFTRDGMRPATSEDRRDAAPHLTDRFQAHWLDRLEALYLDNLRAALDHATASVETENPRRASSRRLAGEVLETR